MRARAALCEHTFGTLKRWMGWDHFLVRGLEKVQGEPALVVHCYNFRRVLSILGLDGFRAACEARRRSGGQGQLEASFFIVCSSWGRLQGRLARRSASRRRFATAAAAPLRYRPPPRRVLARVDGRPRNTCPVSERCHACRDDPRQLPPWPKRPTKPLTSTFQQRPAILTPMAKAKQWPRSAYGTEESGALRVAFKRRDACFSAPLPRPCC
ncbi:transposase [Thiocapsa bogorovii]|nr:transposase [Thiocapsa bogorovii]UHD15495.1 transposase [Thiocapsa bogorovii]